MVTAGTSGDVNVKIQLDEGSVPDFGGTPPRPPGGPAGGGMPPEVLRMFGKQAASEKGASELTREQKEQLAVLKQSQSIQKEAAEYSKSFNKDGTERKSLLQSVGDGIKQSSIGQKVAGSNAAKGAAKMLGGISKLGGPLGMIAGGIGGMLLNTKVMKAGIGGLTSIISAFFDVLMAPLMPAISKGLQALVKIIPWLQAFMKDPSAMIRKLIADIGDWFNGLVEDVKDQWRGFKEWLLNLVPDWAKGFVDSFLDFFGGTAEAWLGLFSGTVEAWLNYFSGVKEAFMSLWDGIVALFMGNWDGALEGFLGYFTGMTDAWIGLFGDLGATWLGFFTDIATTWINLFLNLGADFLRLFGAPGDAIVEFFKTAPGEIVEFFKTAPGAIADYFSGIGDTVAGYFSGVGDTVAEFFKGIPNTITGWFSMLLDGFGGLWKTVSDVAQAVWSGISNVATNIFEWVLYYFKQGINNLPVIGGFMDEAIKPQYSVMETLANAISNVQTTRQSSYQENVINVILNNDFFKERYDVDTRRVDGRDELLININRQGYS